MEGLLGRRGRALIGRPNYELVDGGPQVTASDRSIDRIEMIARREP